MTIIQALWLRLALYCLRRVHPGSAEVVAVHFERFSTTKYGRRPRTSHRSRSADEIRLALSLASKAGGDDTCNMR